MTVDHLSIFGPSLYLLYNWNGNLWVSVAEGFVFLSGFMYGYIYVYLQRKTLKEIFIALFKRTVLLYLLSVSLSLFYSIYFWEFPMPQSGIFINAPKPENLELIMNTLLLHHVYGWADILIIYFYLTLFTPILIILNKAIGARYLLIISCILWIFTNITQFEFYVSIFNVFAWQFLYVFGFVLASNFEKVKQILENLNKNLMLKFFLLLLFITTIILGIYFPNIEFNGYDIVNKGDLGVLRLALFPIWILSLVLIFSELTKLGQSYLKVSIFKKLLNFYQVFGKNSLFVYVFHSVILAFVTAYFLDFGIYLNTLINTFLLILIYYVTINYKAVIRFVKEEVFHKRINLLKIDNEVDPKRIS